MEWLSGLFNNPIVGTIGGVVGAVLGAGLLWKLINLIWTNFKIKNQIQEALDKKLIDPLAEFLADKAVEQINKIPDDQVCKDAGMLLMETPNRFDAIFDARFIAKWRIKI